MSIFSKIIAFFTFLGVLIGGNLGIPVNPYTTEDTGNKILFFSDYQGSDRAEHFTAILDQVPEEPGLIVGGGDYQSLLGPAIMSTYGIYSVRKTVAERWSDEIPFILTQGNHDPKSSKGLTKMGLYEFDEYLVYEIPMAAFPWKQGKKNKAEKTVKETAAALEETFSNLAAKGEERPVFVVTHVPLHKTNRASGKDNAYAGYIFDVLNNYGKKLDIVFLFGHNHSGTYDDYIGGSVNYIAKGGEIYIPGRDGAETLNFTYTNCGYVGYSDNSVSETSTNTLTVSFMTVEEDYITMQRYSEDGAYYDEPIEIELDR